MSLPQFYNPNAHLGLPAPRLHPFARLVLFSLGAIAMQVALSLVVAAAIGTAATVSRQPFDEMMRDFMARFGLWLTLVIYPPLFLWLWLCRGAFDRRSLASLGLRSANAWNLFGGGALGGGAAVALLFGVLWLTQQLFINGSSPEAFDAGSARITLSLLAYAGLFCAVALMEELVFRGYLLHNLAAWCSTRVAIWLQAIAFAVIHLGNIQMQNPTLSGGANDAMRAALWDALRAMPGLILVGAVFALLYFKTGSLWFPIGFHAGWNFFLGCIFSLPVSGISIFRLLDVSVSSNAWLTGGSFGGEGSVLLLPILGAMWWLLRQQPDHPQATLDLALLRPDQMAQMAPQIAVEPQPDQHEAWPEAAQDQSDEPRQSRFKTSMRSADSDVVTPPVVWGQLPRTDSALSAVPVATPALQDTPQSTLDAPDKPTIEPLQSTLETPPAPIESTLPSEPVPTPVSTPLSAPLPTPEQPAVTEKPTPRKPPAPRW